MPPTSLRQWQRRTALQLFVGYSAYYLCRSNLAIAAPLLIREFGGRGLDKEVLGQIASVGVLFYAAGKVVNGVLGDLLGGKKIFLLGMVGAVAATVVFGLGQGVAVFFGAWAANRLVQSMGWAGLVKTTANWFAYQSYGRIMALLSLSYLFGDLVAKLALGQLLGLGLGWRGLFLTAAGLLAAVALLNALLLKNAPRDVGLPAPLVRPDSLFAAAPAAPASVGALLGPYFRSPAFRLMLVLSFGLTALREVLNFWLPTYLVEAAHLSEGAAAQYSALYPLFGMASILGAGYLSDGWLRGRRGPLILAACVPAGARATSHEPARRGRRAAAGARGPHRPAAAGPLLVSGRRHVAGRRGAARRGHRVGPSGCRGLLRRHRGPVADGRPGRAPRLEQRPARAGAARGGHGRRGALVLA